MTKKHRLLRSFLSMLVCFCMLSAMAACKNTGKSPDNNISQSTGDTLTQSTESSATQSTEPSDTQATQASAQATEPTTEPSTAPTTTPTTEPTTEPTELIDPNIYKHVIIVGIDGGGTFFKNANTPNIDRIFANGAITYAAVTENPSISAQSWTSLLHGITNDYHGITNEIASTTPYPTDSPFPSVFKVIKQNDPMARIGSICTWEPINKGIVENGLGVFRTSRSTDGEAASEAISYIYVHAPTFLFVQLGDTDYLGHRDGFGSDTFYETLERADSYIGQIYDACKTKGLLEDGLFIVTADHGGIQNDHGGLTDEERLIMFAATGKTVQKGTIGEMEIRDTAAIVLHALGYEQPETWTARVPSGLFKGVTAGERPVYNGD